MRLSSSRRCEARRSSPWATSFAALAALAPSLAHAIDFQPAPAANLDFSNLGRIGFAGDFDGVSLYQYKDQSSAPASRNGSDSLLAQLPNAAMAAIVPTDASIRAMCTFILSNGEMQGVVIGGNFTSLDDTESTAVALFNPNTTEITPLDGLKGEVNALYCDAERDSVYVGGNFKGGNSTNAVVWVGTAGWTNLPFAGFNGPVSAITKTSNGHIVFGGSFTGLGNSTTPTDPDTQNINLSTANVTASGTSSTDGFDDPANIVCSDGSGKSGTAWLLQDNTPGYWDAKFDFGFEPTKLRLWNTHQDGRGTKTFSFTALPLGGILELTYIDPVTNKNTTCYNECPLSNDPSVEFQDFHFVQLIGMNEFQVGISAWYGDGGGLAGIELSQDNIFAYAINDFNEPSCGGVEFPSSATQTGPWKESPSLQSNSKYLTADLKQPITPESASIVFTPNIVESGNYSINMYTPGCMPDNSCSTRARVNITGVMASGSIDADFTTSTYQTNSFDKYDQIYFGYIEATSDSFKPTVTMTPLAGQDLDTMTMVAQRVGFTLISSSGGLNGLFDFDPSLAVIDTSEFQNSAIDKLGASFDHGTGVVSLVTAGDTTYVAGNFTSDDHSNILAINSNKEVENLDGGLNGEVFDMYLNGTQLYVGGDFSNTLKNAVDGMNNVAVYDTDANTWKALGAGVNGVVQYVVPLQINITEGSPETAIALSGAFTECRAFGGFSAISVEGFAVWVASQGNWLQSLNTTVPSYGGVLTAATLNLPNGDSIFAGSMSSAQIGANGAATLSSGGLGVFPAKIQAQSSSSQLTRRDVGSDGDISGVVTGLFYEEDDTNVTVLAGQFTAQATNGSTIHALLLIDGNDDDSVSGPTSELTSDSTVVTLDVYDGTLFAGGNLEGSIDGNDFQGLFTYDLKSKSFAKQPAAVSGKNRTVSSITVRPNTAEVYVAGSFDRAGALDCPGICLYDGDSDQWTRPGNNMAGNVSCLMWSSNSQLLAGGDLLGNGTDARHMAMYNAKSQTWSDFPGSESLPGPVTTMTLGSSDGKQIWVSGTSSDNGSVYIMKHDGKKWITPKPSLSSDTVIQSMQLFTVTKNHDDSDILDNGQVLMLTGAIDVPNFGIAAAAMFDGTSFQPYALTSSNGGTGSIAKIFSQKDNFFTSPGGHMPLVFVILIGLAISLGLILFLVLGGIILDRVRKRREGYTPAPTSMYDRGSGMQRIPPRELLESLGKGQPSAPHV